MCSSIFKIAHFNKLFKSPSSGLSGRCSSLNDNLIIYIYIYYIKRFLLPVKTRARERTSSVCYATNEYVINHRDFARCFPFGDEIDGVCFKANQVKRECARVVGLRGFEERVEAV